MTTPVSSVARWSVRSLLWSLLLSLPFFLAEVEARAEFQVPELTGPVVDSAGVLSARAVRAIDSALRALHEQGGSQINVLTIASLEGMPIEQASIRIVDQWKLGGRKTDNGVLLLIAVKDHKLRIEVGRGLEGSLTDADSKRIIDQGIVPLLKSGDFDSAVIVGVYQIARKTDPGVDLSPYLEGKVRTRHLPDAGGIPLRFWVIFAIVVLFFILGGFGGRGGRGRGSGFYGGGWGGGGGWSGGGGGWSGGSGGGSWEGGGGGFSGGGASGDW